MAQFGKYSIVNLRRLRARSPGVTVTGLLLATLSSCGGSEVQSEPAGLDCGPHGNVHDGPGIEAHCDCNAGYVVEDGTCVEDATPPSAPGTNTDGNELDCGPHGEYDGLRCVCDPGHTQTGLQEARTCEAIPPCQGPNDGFEPNNIPEEAAALSSVQGDLYACPADADWFVMPVNTGDRVRVELRFDGDVADLDLYLFGPSGPEPKALSLGSFGDMEAAEFVARADGTAGILVASYGIGESAYQLAVDIQAGAAPMCAGAGGSCRAPADCCSNNCHIGHCH